MDNNLNYIELLANRHFFLADGNNELEVNQEDITISFQLPTDVKEIKVYQNINGKSEDDITDIAIVDGNIVVTAGMFGTSNTYTIIVKGTNSKTLDILSSSVTISRAKQGINGMGAVVVKLVSDKNGNVFKNNLADTHIKTIKAKVFDMTTGDEIYKGVSYLWRVNGEVARVDENQTINPTEYNTATYPYIRLNSAIVPFGEAIELSCDVEIDSNFVCKCGC